MLQEGEAFCVHAPNWEAAGLFIVGEGECYYGVGKSIDSFCSHPILWKAITYAKRIGCIDFEIGEQFFTGDEKAKAISMFKRGFGGLCKIRLEWRH
jgi:hypothetical protein